MRISALEGIPVKIPFRIPLQESVGRYQEITPVLIKIHTDEGIHGVGEVQSYPLFEREGVEPPASILSLLRSHFQPLLEGKDPFQIEAISFEMDELVKGHLWIKSGIDIALYDLKAKAMGVPAYDLLGGPSRLEHVVEGVGFGISIDDPPRVADIAAQAAADGYVELELKAGGSPRDDIRRVELVRRAIGSTIPLKIDFNRGYDARTAINIIRGMEHFGIQLVEQPVPAWDLEGLSFLRRSISTPLIVDESVSTPEDLMRIIRAGAADGVHIKPTIKGGLTGAMRLAHLAEAAGLRIIPGTNIPTGVGFGAVHTFLASARVVHRGIHGSPLDALGEDVVEEPIPPGTTRVRISQRPGLGIELSEKQVARLRVDRG